jgi:acetone carboxylase gamma subunit
MSKTGKTAEQKGTVWPKDVLKDLVAGRLDPDTLLQMQRAPKEAGRFEAILEIEQERVPWKDRILVPIGEGLYIVENERGRVVKHICGQEFGNYKVNWKLSALIYERDSKEKLQEIYRGPRACNPDWMVLREYICPKCGTIIETEAVPPGYPIVFNFLPDEDALNEISESLK